MKLNKASQQTLTELSKFLKVIGGAKIEGSTEAKALSKALTQMRANIKEVETYITTITGQPEPLPEGMKPFVPPKVDESGHIMNLPTTPAESEAARVQAAVAEANATGTDPYLAGISARGEVVVESGLGGTFTAAEAPTDMTLQASKIGLPTPEYELAVYVSETQVNAKASLLGARQQSEGNFTLPLYRKK